jgi:hypothetical protein
MRSQSGRGHPPGGDTRSLRFSTPPRRFPSASRRRHRHTVSGSPSSGSTADRVRVACRLLAVALRELGESG